MDPHEFEQRHAKTVNFFARVFGVLAIIAGVVFTVWGLSLVLNPKATIDLGGVPSSDPWIKTGILVVGLVIVTIGILMLKAKPYNSPK